MFVPFISNLEANTQRLSVSGSGLMEFANVSPGELRDFMDVRNSAGYQLGLFYELALKGDLSVESGLSFRYGMSNQFNSLNLSNYDVPMRIHDNSPIQFIDGVIPLNIIYSIRMNIKYKLVFKGGFFYLGNLISESSIDYRDGGYYKETKSYSYDESYDLQHSIGNSFSLGIGRELDKQSEIHFNILLGYTFKKRILGDITIMSGYVQELSGELYKTGSYMGIELRYYFKKGK
jgi:hypothetical protein